MVYTKLFYLAEIKNSQNEAISPQENIVILFFDFLRESATAVFRRKQVQ